MQDVLTGALTLSTSSLNSRVTTRVSRLLARLGHERQRRALPRVYHYVRTVPPSPRPGALEQSSGLCRSQP